MKRLSSIIVALVLAGFSALACAEAKVGVVDLQKIMQTSPQMQAIQKKLEGQFKPRRDKLVAMEDSIKKDMEKFKRDAAVMSQNDKKNLEKKIVSNQQNFEREGQQYQQELSTAHNEAMEDFYGKIRTAISKVAAAEKYDIVLQKDAAPFSTEKFDITLKVLKEVK
jgi:outer membrane protein